MGACWGFCLSQMSAPGLYCSEPASRGTQTGLPPSSCVGCAWCKSRSAIHQDFSVHGASWGAVPWRWWPWLEPQRKEGVSFSSQSCFPKKIRGRQLPRWATVEQGTELPSHLGRVSVGGRWAHSVTKNREKQVGRNTLGRSSLVTASQGSWPSRTGCGSSGRAATPTTEKRGWGGVWTQGDGGEFWLGRGHHPDLGDRAVGLWETLQEA